MPRVLFEKTGNAVWMSHLDTMRLFQRMFKRAGLPLKHTQGFNPRPTVSIALPLSVGAESRCELLDFELEGGAAPCHEIQERLNRASVSGVRIREVYEEGRKIKHLAYLHCTVSMEYDAGVTRECLFSIHTLFRRDTLTVTKKSKNGPVEQDIIPMIRKMTVVMENPNTVLLDCMICCQNPSLNPMQLVSAVERYLSDMTPDFAKCARIEIYDTEEQIFR